MTTENKYLVAIRDASTLQDLDAFLTGRGESPAQLVRLNPSHNSYVTADHALPLQRRLNEAISIFQSSQGDHAPTISLRKPYQLSQRQQRTFLDLVVNIPTLMTGASASALARCITAGPSPESPILVDGVNLYEFLVVGATVADDAEPAAEPLDVLLCSAPTPPDENDPNLQFSVDSMAPPPGVNQPEPARF